MNYDNLFIRFLNENKNSTVILLKKIYDVNMPVDMFNSLNENGILLCYINNWIEFNNSDLFMIIQLDYDKIFTYYLINKDIYHYL